MPERSSWKQRSALAYLTSVRLKEFLREPDAVFWTFGFPILLAIGLGIAFRNRPAETVNVAVVESDARADSAAAALARAQGVAVVRAAPESAAAALRTGRVAIVVSSDATGIRYTFDDTRPDARVARMLVDDALQRSSGRRDPLPVQERKVREAGSRYIDFVIPGLLGMNIMGGGIWGLGFTIVDARRRHLLKRLSATPMSRSEYLLSFLFSRLAFLIIELVVVLGFATLVFGVPIRGSLFQLAVVALVASLTFSGLGLLVASRARTLESASGLMNLVMLPMWVLSGIFFSAANFPPTAQPFIQALPLTAVIDALRATMLQGSGWSIVLPELGIAAAWMIGTFVLALKLFRWR
jgi:ABC-2 type transport system permease protein